MSHPTFESLLSAWMYIRQRKLSGWQPSRRGLHEWKLERTNGPIPRREPPHNPAEWAATLEQRSPLPDLREGLGPRPTIWPMVRLAPPLPEPPKQDVPWGLVRL